MGDTYFIAREAVVELNDLYVIGAQATLLVNVGGSLSSHVIPNNFDATLFCE
jgi:hypothetical protein